MHLTILQNLLEANEKKAEEIRKYLNQKNITMINLISSPGSGKTTLLEKILPRLSAQYRVAIIEGDVETDKDAQRLSHYSVPISLINTKGSCHLESVSIEKSLEAFNLDALDLILVENVGNLVCPAEFDIGENAKVALVSIPEGDDKIMKYPLLFRESSLIILNKMDLLPYSDFNKHHFYEALSQINPTAKVLELSCKTGEGLDSFVQWLDQQMQKGVIP